MINYKPQNEFPRFKEACLCFDIKKGTCFTFGDVFYTDMAPIPDDFIIHEQVHTKQQARTSPNEWWDKYFKDSVFRLEQEIECYQAQLASIKDKNARFRRKVQVIEDLSGPMYGNITTKEMLYALLK